MTLEQQIEQFIDKWAPAEIPGDEHFVQELQVLMEAYAKAAWDLYRRSQREAAEHKRG